MERNQYSQEEFIRLVVRLVVEELRKMERSVPIGVSNRHIHLDRADMDALFGPGSELTRKKDLASLGSTRPKRPLPSMGPRGS